ncbi:hypothetical protein FNF27_05480 [Cafeteria roenbergensis]|uniref:Uncharacterized protein n=1 Tax=Cafeteria roenbergensis TaxID=33653 RepID=A0A5A8E684_CAFRO|nr:hypothetical protein FNF27_05480 [Cafeteria roenbergensis]
MQQQPFEVDAKTVAALSARDGAPARSDSVVIGRQPVLQEHSAVEAVLRVKLHACAITVAAVSIILLIVSMVSPVMDGVLSDGTSFGVMAFQVRLCPPPGAAAAACVAASAFAPLPPKYANEPLGSHLTSAAVGGVLQLLSLLTVAAFVALAAVRARDETMLGRIHSACELRAGIVVPGVGILASLLCVVGALFVVANTDGGDRNPSDSTGPGFNLAMSAFCMIGCAVVCTAAGSHEIAGVRYQRRREAEAAWQRSRRSSRGSSTAAVLAAVDGGAGAYRPRRAGGVAREIRHCRH